MPIFNALALAMGNARLNLLGGGGFLLGGETFAADLRYTLTPVVDAGSGYTYTRGPAGGTIIDHEGLVKDVGDDEVMIDGSRRVGNLFPVVDADTFVSFAGSTITEANGGITFTQTGTVHVAYHAHADSFLGKQVTYSFEIKKVSGAPYIASVYCGSYLIQVLSPVITPTDEWVRYAIVAYSAGSPSHFGFQNSSGGWVTGDAFVIRNIQIEDVTGQTDKNPSDYVSVGVGTGDELMPDPTVVTEAQWNLSVGSTWIGPGFSLDTGASLVYANNEPNAVVGRQYVITYTVTGWVSDGAAGLGMNYGGAYVSSQPGGNGTFTEVVRATTASGLKYQDTTGSPEMNITFVSVKEVDHGTNVDGVKYSRFENDRSVVSNVVSGGDGDAIADIKGVGVWEDRTNLITYSEDISDTLWLKEAVTYSEDIDVAPDGTTTMDRIDITNAVTDEHRISYNSAGASLTITSGANYTWSAYVKDDGCGFCTLSRANSSENFISATFDLSDGSVTKLDQGTSTGTHVDQGAELEDGIWRLWMSGSYTGTNAYCYVAGAGAGTFTGNIVGLHEYDPGAEGKDLLVWGMQLEAGSFPGPYIPTVASTVARLDADLDYGVENYTTVGWIVAEFEVAASTAGAERNIICFSDEDTALKSLAVFLSTANILRVIIKSGVSDVLLVQDSASALPVGSHTFGLSWDEDNTDLVLVCDGGVIAMDAQQYIYTPFTGHSLDGVVDNFTIGRREDSSGSGYYFNGNISKVHKGDTWKTQAELEDMTA